MFHEIVLNNLCTNGYNNKLTSSQLLCSKVRLNFTKQCKSGGREQKKAFVINAEFKMSLTLSILFLQRKKMFKECH